MSERPKWPFALAHDGKTSPEKPDKEPAIRDKDNAQLRLDPPNKESAPRLDIAPAGAVGVKRNLQTPAHQKAKRFDVKPGAATKDFKSPSRPKGPDRDFDR